MLVKIPQPIDLLCDNNMTVHIVLNSVFHEKMKYIGADFHYIRLQYQAKLLNLLHVSSHNNSLTYLPRLLEVANFAFFCMKLT